MAYRQLYRTVPGGDRAASDVGVGTATAADDAVITAPPHDGDVRRLRYGMLGPVVVHRDGRPEEVMGRRSQTVLVCLLLARGRSVSDQRLIDALYGSQPASSARNQIQQAVCALRRLDVPIARVDGGYILPVVDEEVDAFTFEQRLRSASAVAERGRYEDAVALLREGFALWRGQPLAGLDGPLAAMTRTNLEELRIAALVERVNAELELGRHTRLIGELRDLVAEHPLHERFHAQLMLALYRDGRQAEALEVFAALHQVLVEELGTDPSPAVQELHRQVLAQDPKLDGPGPASAVPRQLPPPQPLLVGRDAERRCIRKALEKDGPRVVAITGFGGMGKTALAVHTAHELADRFPDGQLFMNLSGPVDPTDVLGVFLRALGLHEAEVPDGLAQRSACLRSLVAGLRLLIVLDDAWSRDQVLPLLPGTDGCAVIVTSRSWEISALDWEPVQLGPLAEPDARLLLAHGVGQMLLDAEPRTTQEVLDRCAGMPLALEIVSVRLRSRHAPMSRIAERLADRDRMLTELSLGERAVRTVLEIGYQTLDAPLQTLLRRIACYGSGQVTPELAAALADLPLARAGYLLDDLVDAEFLQACADQGGYHCHDMVLAYCHQRALGEDSAEVRAAALERAFGWWLTCGDAAHTAIFGGRYWKVQGRAPRWAPDDVVTPPDGRQWLKENRCRLAHALSRAIEAGMDEQAWELALAVVPLHTVGGYFDQWQDGHQRALALVRRAGNTRGEAALSYSLGCRALLRHDHHGAARHLSEAGVLADLDGDVHLHGLAMSKLAITLHRRHEIVKALGLYERASAQLRRAEDVAAESGTLNSMADALLALGDRERAGACLDRALLLCRRTGDLRLKAQILRNRGRLAAAAGDSAGAELSHRAALEITVTIGDTLGQVCLGLDAAARLREADPERAYLMLLDACDLAHRCGDRNARERVDAALADLQQRRGDWRLAHDDRAMAGISHPPGSARTP